ncbi:hypothetical protein ACWDTI_18145 [Gordonia sp. NPDC003424]
MSSTRPHYSRPWYARPLFSHPARHHNRPELFAFGGDNARGYSTAGDVLVSETADGVDLSTIWDEAASAMSMWNQQRSALAGLVSYPTIGAGDAIPQSIGGDHFGVASEFGEPEGIRAEPNALILGYDFEDYDLATRFSWKFLRSATAEQVRSVINRAMESDNRLTTGTILRRLFNPVAAQNEFGQSVYGLYNGTDGMVPPSYAGQQFTSTTSHYLVSGNTALDPGDLLDACDAVRSKGFGISANSRLLILCHPNEAEVISMFRRGEETNLDFSR